MPLGGYRGRAEHRHPLAGTNSYCLMTEKCACKPVV